MELNKRYKNAPLMIQYQMNRYMKIQNEPDNKSFFNLDAFLCDLRNEIIELKQEINNKGAVMARKGSCGGTPSVGKKGDKKPVRGRGRGKGRK